MKLTKKYQTHEKPKRTGATARARGALKGGTLSHFQHPKYGRGSFGEKNFSKKSHNAEKNCKGDPLVSPGIVCYAEKDEVPFWFSSLGQMIQFGTIKFRRTFKNYFGRFVWIEKKSH